MRWAEAAEAEEALAAERLAERLAVEAVGRMVVTRTAGVFANPGRRRQSGLALGSVEDEFELFSPP